MNEEMSIEVYTKVADTVYRLENWSAEELEMYCGIYKEEK